MPCPPVLFSLYTDDCRSRNEDCRIIEYADDTVIIAKIVEDDSTAYEAQVSEFMEWCNINSCLKCQEKKRNYYTFQEKKKETDHPEPSFDRQRRYREGERI